MPSCFIKRVLPFALAFLCGVAAWQLVGFKLRFGGDVLCLEEGPRGRAGRWAAARPDDERSRTWLVVRAPRAVAVSRGKAPECDNCSVQMRVLFGADGAAVPGNGFSVSAAAYPLIEDAVAEARRVSFKPATRDGKPASLWANATYECGSDASTPQRLTCRLTVDRDSARTWDGRPWRVIYE